MRAPKHGTKYWPLYQFLEKTKLPTLTLSFGQIEQILEQPLPVSARKQTAFWSNRKRGALQAQAWMAAGFRVVEVRLEEGWVMLVQPLLRYRQRGVKVTDRWDGESIKALRHHMEISQAELAVELGVRQQTISEWETGVYQPRRSSSKQLSIVADRAKFPYKASAEEDNVDRTS